MSPPPKPPAGPTPAAAEPARQGWSPLNAWGAPGEQPSSAGLQQQQQAAASQQAFSPFGDSPFLRAFSTHKCAAWPWRALRALDRELQLWHCPARAACCMGSSPACLH